MRPKTDDNLLQAVAREYGHDVHLEWRATNITLAERRDAEVNVRTIGRRKPDNDSLVAEIVYDHWPNHSLGGWTAA